MSDRLLPRASSTLYRIKKQDGPNVVVLAGLGTGSSEFGFAQPVAIGRLVPYDLCELEETIAGALPRLGLYRSGGWQVGGVRVQIATGAWI